VGNAQEAGDAEKPYQPSKGQLRTQIPLTSRNHTISTTFSFYISKMANRGKSHDSKVYSIEDLERLGSERMHKAYRGRYNLLKDIIRQS
jgi:hypothetical protein